MSKNPYQILEIESNASQEQIKTAYRKLALKHHPDKNNNSAEANKKFQEIVKAYEILSDLTTRSKYDNNSDPNSFWESFITKPWYNLFLYKQKANNEIEKKCLIYEVSLSAFKEIDSIDDIFAGHQKCPKNINTFFNYQYHTHVIYCLKDYNQVDDFVRKLSEVIEK